MGPFIFTTLSVIAYLFMLRWLTLRLPPSSPFEDSTLPVLGCLILALPAALGVQGIGYLVGVYS